MIVFFYRHFPGLIENGHLYISLPPLYSIVERGKKHYFLNDEEYEEYIFGIIKDKFKLSGNSKITKVFLGRLEEYTKFVDNISNNTGLNNYLINHSALLYHKCKGDKKKLFNSLKKEFEFLEFKKDKKDIVIQGLVDDEYINTSFIEIIKTAIMVNEKLSKLKLSYTIEFEFKEKDYDLFPNELYTMMIEKSTPKTRQRLKGLGEMNSEDLWETTMDPARRRCIQVTVNDIDEAHNTLENLFNSKTKYSDKRKAFIKRNQDKFDSTSLE